MVWCGENGNEIGGRKDHVRPSFILRVLDFTLGDEKPLEGFEQREQHEQDLLRFSI